MFDISSFGKLLVQGRDAVGTAAKDLRRRRGRRAGQVVYTQWLNERGGIEADVTVTRVAETEFLVVTAAATRPRCEPVLRAHPATRSSPSRT